VFPSNDSDFSDCRVAVAAPVARCSRGASRADDAGGVKALSVISIDSNDPKQRFPVDSNGKSVNYPRRDRRRYAKSQQQLEEEEGLPEGVFLRNGDLASDWQSAARSRYCVAIFSRAVHPDCTALVQSLSDRDACVARKVLPMDFKKCVVFPGGVDPLATSASDGALTWVVLLWTTTSYYPSRWSIFFLGKKGATGADGFAALRVIVKTDTKRRFECGDFFSSVLRDLGIPPTDVSRYFVDDQVVFPLLAFLFVCFFASLPSFFLILCVSGGGVLGAPGLHGRGGQRASPCERLCSAGGSSQVARQSPLLLLQGGACRRSRRSVSSSSCHRFRLPVSSRLG
jgi:hypothetical protein